MVNFDKLLKGKDYKAGLRLHRLTWQACWRIILPMFFDYLKDANQDLFNDLNTLGKFDSFDCLVTRLNSAELKQSLEMFIEDKKQDKNFAFIWSYLEMVQMLLAFTRTNRENDWDLHMYAFTNMLHDFMQWVFQGILQCIVVLILKSSIHTRVHDILNLFDSKLLSQSYDHQNYAKLGVIYVVEMYIIPECAKKGLRRGFSVQWVEGEPFSGVDHDHATEWMNGLSKDSGGFSDVAHIDSTGLRWILSFHPRCAIVKETESYFLPAKSSEISSTKSEFKLESEYEDKLVEAMLKHNLFRGGSQPHKLTTLVTKDVVPTEIEDSLLQRTSLGYEGVVKCIKERLFAEQDGDNPQKSFDSRTFQEC